MKVAKVVLLVWTLFWLWILAQTWQEGHHGANGLQFIITMILWSIGTVPIALIGLLFRRAT